MASGKRSHRGLKICCGVTALFLVILLVVLVVLFLTVLKPKKPETTAKLVSFENIQFQFLPLKLNATLGLLITITNRNYGSFKYKNTTTYINYRDTVIAQAPIEEDSIPARGTHNISTSLEIIADKLVSNPYFFADVRAGSLNFTTSTTLRGKITMFKILKLRATVYSNCDISLFVRSRRVESKCNSEVDI